MSFVSVHLKIVINLIVNNNCRNFFNYKKKYKSLWETYTIIIFFSIFISYNEIILFF